LGEKVKEAEDRLNHIIDTVENYFLLVKTLSENGVDKDEKNQYGQTALEMAIKAGAKKIAAYLNGENVDEDSVKTGGMNLHQAVIKGDLEAIAALLQNGADPNVLLDGEPTDESRNYVGCTPLATACDYKNAEAVQLLLQNGALPDLKNGDGKSPVVWLASTAAHHVSMQKVYQEKRIGQILKAFLEAGYKIDQTVDDEANTIITYALKYAGHSYINHFFLKAVIVDEALRYRPNPNLANHAGQTPLMLVCREDAVEMENLLLHLLESGVEVNAKDSQGNTALHYAARNSTKNTAKTYSQLLLDFDADASLADNGGQTPIDIATANENEPLVKLLLSKM
jgi:ankyrin repeat protein